MPEVAGEEVLNVDISKGLWIGSSYNISSFTFPGTANVQEVAPDGYCSSLRNLIKNKRGNWEPRKSLNVLQGSFWAGTLLARSVSGTYNGYEYFVVSDESKMSYWLPAYKENLPVIIDTGSHVLYNYRPPSGVSGGPASKRTINYNVPANTYQPRTYTMYKDRMYACNSSTGAWYRLTGWGTFVTTPFSFTETLLPGANNTGMTDLTGIFAFKDRFFCYKDNRVYFTDVAPTGGYPEAWDNTINFFDIPSSGSPKIWNAFIIQNLVYLFTEDGVYTLQVYGTPDLWVVRKLRDDISIYHHFAACVNDGVIYFVNGRGIFAFNGDKVVEIGQPLQYLSSSSNGNTVGFGLAAYEDGCLLTYQRYNVVTTDYIVTEALVFYFDGEVWSQFTVGASLVAGIPTNISDILSVSSTLPKTILYYLGGNQPCTVLNISVSATSANGVVSSMPVSDGVGTLSDSFGGGTSYGGAYFVQLSTPFIIPAKGQYTYFKSIEADYYGNILDRFYLEWVTVKGVISSSNPATPMSLTNSYSGYHTAKCHNAPDQTMGIMVHILAHMTVTGGSHSSPLEILAVRLVKNTGRRITETDNWS